MNVNNNPRYLRKVVGVANRPELNKFIVKLSCDHETVYDHSVDSVSEYGPGMKLICYQCQNKKHH